MSTVQTVPVYLTSRSGSNLNNASPFTSGYSSFANPTAPFDLNLIPSNSGPLYTESDVVEDLSFRSTTQSVFPPQMDWCRPLRPSTSYIVPVQSDPMISTSRNPYSDIQRFYQDFTLPNYTLDTFSGRLFDVISSTTFTSGDVQTELHHAITRLIVSVCVFKFWFLLSNYSISWILNIDCNFIHRLFDIYEPGVCHFIDHEASLGNASPLLDASHPACEVIRGDTQWLRSNFLWVYYVYLLNFGSNYLFIYLFYWQFYNEKVTLLNLGLVLILYFLFLLAMLYWLCWIDRDYLLYFQLMMMKTEWCFSIEPAVSNI